MKECQNKAKRDGSGTKVVMRCLQKMFFSKRKGTKGREILTEKWRSAKEVFSVTHKNYRRKGSYRLSQAIEFREHECYKESI